MIVITGASDGLGKELATVFKEAGKTVVNVSRTQNDAVENIICDLSSADSVEQAAAHIIDRNEPLELLINCAGVMSVEPITEISADEIKKIFAVNIEGPMLLTSRLAEKITVDDGDIVNIASTVGTKAYESQAAYGSSKWAMRGFSHNLQLEFKNSSVRVLSVCVGGMNTKMGEKIGNKMTDPENWMDANDIALMIKSFIDVPKLIEVSEITINRKAR